MRPQIFLRLYKVSTISLLLLISIKNYSQITLDSATITNFQQTMDSFTKRVKETDKKEQELQKRLDEANQVNSNLSAFISAFETVYAIVSIALGLLSIALVALTVYLGIRTNKAIRDAKLTVDKTLKEHHKISRQEKLKQAISNICAPKNERTIYSLNYISLTPEELFSEQDYFQIYRALKYADKETEIAITSIFLRKNLDYIEDYFRSKLVAPNVDRSILYNGLIFFAKYNFESNLDVIAESILNITPRSQRYNQFIQWLILDYKQFVLSLLNYRPLYDRLIDNDRNMIKEELNSTTYDAIREKINESPFFR